MDGEIEENSAINGEDEREVADKDEFLEHLELQEKLKYIVLKGGDHFLDSEETPEQKWSGSL